MGGPAQWNACFGSPSSPVLGAVLDHFPCLGPYLCPVCGLFCCWGAGLGHLAQRRCCVGRDVRSLVLTPSVGVVTPMGCRCGEVRVLVRGATGFALPTSASLCCGVAATSVQDPPTRRTNLANVVRQLPATPPPLWCCCGPAHLRCDSCCASPPRCVAPPCTPRTVDWLCRTVSARDMYVGIMGVKFWFRPSLPRKKGRSRSPEGLRPGTIPFANASAGAVGTA